MTIILLVISLLDDVIQTLPKNFSIAFISGILEKDKEKANMFGIRFFFQVEY